MPFNATSPGTGSPYYGGGQVANPANVLVLTAAPNAAATGNPVGTIAINSGPGTCYIAVKNTGINGTVTWEQIGLAAGTVGTLTPDSGGAVSPLAGNIAITGGTGINSVGTANTVTFNVVGTGLKTTVSAATPSTPAINTRLVTNTAGLYTANLPAVAAVGSSIRITGLGAGGWLLQCGAGQTINSSGGSTTSGGSLASTNRYDCVLVTCTVANTGWIAETIVGNLTNA